MPFLKLTSIFILLALSCGLNKPITAKECVKETQAMVSFIKTSDFEGLHSFLSKRIPVEKRDITVSSLSKHFGSIRDFIAQSKNDTLRFNLFVEKPHDYLFGCCIVTTYLGSTKLFTAKFDADIKGKFSLSYIENSLDLPKLKRNAAEFMPAPGK